MKKLFAIFTFALLFISAKAQYYYPNVFVDPYGFQQRVLQEQEQQMKQSIKNMKFNFNPNQSQSAPIQQNNSYNNSNNNESNSSANNNESNSIPRTKCPNCTNGRRVYEGDVAYSGTDIRYSTCNECGKRYMSSHTWHRHGSCNTCHGTGYLD